MKPNSLGALYHFTAPSSSIAGRSTKPPRSRLRSHPRHQSRPGAAPAGPKNRGSILFDFRRLALDDLARLFLRLMLDGPQLGQPGPDPLGQIERVARSLLRRHLTEPVLKRARHVDLLSVAP